MTVTVANIRVAVSGAVYKGTYPMTAPTGTSGAPTGSPTPVDLGAISEEGVELQIPGSGDSTPIKLWDGTIARTIRTPSDDYPTWKLTFVETSLPVVETYFGATVTQAASDGSFAYTVTNRAHIPFVIDYVDGSNLTRDFVPYGLVTDVDSQQLNNKDAVKYSVTIAGELDPTLGYNFKRFMSALKTP